MPSIHVVNTTTSFSETNIWVCSSGTAYIDNIKIYDKLISSNNYVLIYDPLYELFTETYDKIIRDIKLNYRIFQLSGSLKILSKDEYVKYKMKSKLLNYGFEI